MINNNYALNQAKQLSNNIERVKNDNIDIYIAKRNPPYIETSQDRPNFFSKWLYDKAVKLEPTLTKEQYVDNQMAAYESNTLGLTNIKDKAIVNAYMIDNIMLTMTLRPYELANQLGIDIVEIYSLNYIKIVMKDTKETKYMWIDSIINNDSRRDSITITCTTDRWMTYYKQVFLNARGDVKIIRKHFDRFIERPETDVEGYKEWLPEVEILINELITHNGFYYICIETHTSTDVFDEAKFTIREPVIIGSYLVGNYAKDSNVWNVDNNFGSLTTGTFRSLAVNTREQATTIPELIEIVNNEILFELSNNILTNTNIFFPSINWPKEVYNNTYLKFQGNKVPEDSHAIITFQHAASGYIAASSSYNKGGVLHVNDTILYDNIAPDVEIKNNDILPNLSDRKYGYGMSIYFSNNRLDDNGFGKNIFPQGSKCYGPTKVDIAASTKYNYFYTYQKQLKSKDGLLEDPGIDAYEIRATKVWDEKTPLFLGNPQNLINRVGNVISLVNGSAITSFSTKQNILQNKETKDWRWLVKGSLTTYQEDEKRASFSPGSNIRGGITIYEKIPSTKENDLKLFLVNYNSRQGFQTYGEEYLVNTAFITSCFGKVFDGNLRELDTPHRAVDAIGYSKPIFQVVFDDIDKKNLFVYYQNVKLVQPSTPILFEVSNLNSYSTGNVRDNGFSGINKENNAIWSISDWNRFSTVPCYFNGQLELQEYANLMETNTLKFKKVNYVKDEDWNFTYEPQIKMSHCIKHFIDYLGVRKQLFLELGGASKFWIKQSILPNSCLDKIYWNDDEATYLAQELIQTNGFLVKTYDNSLPSLTDTYLSFMNTSGAQFSNQKLTANQNLEYTKQQASLNSQQQQLNAKKGIVSDVGGAISGGISLAAGIATGGAGAIIGGATKAAGGIGGLIFGSQQRELDRKQTSLNNEKSIFNAEQQVNQINAFQKDLYNAPDQLNQGSVDCIGIIQYQQDLSYLFQVNGQGRVKFKIDSQAPTINELTSYSLHLHQYGYISNNMLFDVGVDDLISRTRFNYMQIGEVQNMFKDTLAPLEVKNYFMNMFNKGLRIWNLDYEGQKMLDYSKENWEISLENK